MQKHSLDTVRQIKKLRKKGYSLNDLVRQFSIPKTTVWHHVHEISVPSKYIAIIKAKQGGSKIRSQKDWQKADQQAREILNSDRKHPCALLAMLYWAEGNKKGLVFTNTDGRMITFYITLLRRYFYVKESDIKITIRVFSNLDKKECLKYWARVIGIPKKRITLYFNDGGTKGKARYGICRVTIAKSGYLTKLIMSLIRQVAGEFIGE